MVRDTPSGLLIGGDPLEGRYRLVERLGVEATGAAYLAETVEGGRLARIRLLPGVFAEDDPYTRRFLLQIDEATERSESHATFVALLEAGRTRDGRLFAAFDHPGPRRLTDVLREEAPLELRRAIRLAIQIGEGLEAAQSLGLPELSIEPARIAIVGSEGVKLLATELVALQALGGLDRSKSASANLKPAPPEQRGGEAATDRAAAYAFGSVAHQILTGARSPTDPTAAARVLRTARPGIPQELVRVVCEALDPEPARRPSSVTTMLNQLSVELVRLDDPSVGLRRWPLVGGVAGVVTLFIMAGFWFQPAPGSAGRDTLGRPPRPLETTVAGQATPAAQATLPVQTAPPVQAAPPQGAPPVQATLPVPAASQARVTPSVPTVPPVQTTPPVEAAPPFQTTPPATVPAPQHHPVGRRPDSALSQGAPTVQPTETKTAESSVTAVGLPPVRPARPSTRPVAAAPVTLEQSLPAAPPRDSTPPVAGAAIEAPLRATSRTEPAQRESEETDPDPRAVIDWVFGKPRAGP